MSLFMSVVVVALSLLARWIEEVAELPPSNTRKHRYQLEPHMAEMVVLP